MPVQGCYFWKLYPPAYFSISNDHRSGNMECTFSVFIQQGSSRRVPDLNGWKPADPVVWDPIRQNNGKFCLVPLCSLEGNLYFCVYIYVCVYISLSCGTGSATNGSTNCQKFALRAFIQTNFVLILRSRVFSLLFLNLAVCSTKETV